MNKTLLYALFLGFCAMFSWPRLGYTQFLNWQFEDVLTDERRSGAYPDMVAGPDGDLHFSCWDRIRDRLLYGRRNKTTGQWQYTYIDSLRPGGYRSALGLDPAGNVHIAFYGNQQGVAVLRYATQQAGAWQVQEIYSLDSTLGLYGPDPSIDTYLELSVDLAFDPSGRPVITFFDGDIQNMRNCINQFFPFTYDLNLYIARLLPNNSWEVMPLQHPRTSSTGCVNPGRNQDRFGEFSKLIPQHSDTSYMVVTNSLYNHEMVLFQSAPDTFSQWRTTLLDSAERVVNPILLRTDEGFAFSDARFTSGSKGRILHTVYNLCESYGLRATIPAGSPFRRSFFYTRIKLDSLGIGAYTPYHYEFVLPPRDNHYRTYFSLLAPHEDSLYLAYYDANDGAVVLTSSVNGGRAWQRDTVLKHFNTTCRLVLERYRDSLFLASYDASRDQLLLSSRRLGGGNWKHQMATPSERRALYLSAAVDSSSPGNAILHLAFDEGVSDVLYYGQGGGGAWNFEEVDARAEGLRDIDLQLDATGQPFITYVWEESRRLQFAYYTGGTWQTELVQGGGIPESPSLAILGDTVYIAFYDRAQRALMLARSVPGSGSWQLSELDGQSGDTGQFPKLLASPGGTLHLAYKDAAKRLLRYGYRNPMGSWVLEDATDSALYEVSNISLQVTRQDELPVVAFRDAQRNLITLAEKSLQGDWAIDTVISGQTNFLGSPLQLLLDPQDNRWVLYNFVTSTEELRLLRRTPEGRTWFPVSVLNNEAQVAGSFAFRQGGEDFFILGRKNRIEDWGIGLLYAPGGATTDLEGRSGKALQWELFPNPASTHTTIQLSLEEAASVSIALYDLQGKRVSAGMPSAPVPAGTHRFELSTVGIPSGLYLCQLRLGDRNWVKKLVIAPR